MTTTDDSRPLTDAEETYLRFLLEHAHEVPAQVASSPAASPDLGGGLRELHARWLAVGRRGPVADGSTLSELRSLLGDEIDPAIRLSEVAEAGSTGGAERRPGPAAGGYSVLGRLAEGRLGTILAVRDRNLDRPLAMKVHREGSPLREFFREAAVISTLAHPGILPVHELGVDRDGRAFFTMRRLRGAHLDTVLADARKRRDGWTIDRALRILIRVCDTLAAAHEQGVVHGDLDPGSVLVGDFGEVVVTGWSRAVCRDEPEVEELELVTHGELSLADELVAAEEARPEALRPAGTRDHTPYLAPEAAGDGAAVGAAADVYSIGALLHHLCTGRPPEGGAGPGRSLKAPPELVAICRRAMDPIPERRYPGPSAIAEELHAYCEHRIVRAYRTGAVAELVQWVRRHRAPAAGVLGVLAILLGGMVPVAFKIEEIRTVRGELADWTSLDDLQKRRYDTLWPLDGRPGTVQALRDWLSRADELYERTADHAAARNELLEGVGASPPTPRSISGLQWARNQSVFARTVAGCIESSERFDALPRTERETRIVAAIETTRLHAEETVNMNCGSLGLSGRFDATSRDDWRVQAHDRFLRDLRHVAPLPEPGTTLWAPDFRKRQVVETAIAFAVRWEEELESVSAERWREVTLDLASDPRFRGLDFPGQYGLVPIGRDSRSGLWEFWDARTGTEPVRRVNGELAIGTKTGMVFVLVPGGRVCVGAQASDPRAGFYDPAAAVDGQTLPLHEVRLEPFLISKYEMTQAQWSRYCGDRSFYRTGTTEGCQHAVRPDHPQEQMKLDEALAGLGILALELPTEEQWEYAARGGTETTYWFGEHAEEIVGREHVDATRGGTLVFANSEQYAEHLEYAVHAPVGLFAPNGFGLHDVSGNVSEWCRPGEGTDAGFVNRGGNWSLGADELEEAAIARRHRFDRDLESSSIGVRPIRRIVR